MKTVRIGRSSQCDIILTDSNISRVHAEMWITNGQYVYYDKSSNGTIINGHTIINRKMVINPGTVVLLANKVPLPWDKIYPLLPLSVYRENEVATAYKESYQPEVQQQIYNQSTIDKLSFGWGVLAFILPLAGFVMYFTWKNETPNRANAAGIVGILSFVLNIIYISGI